MSKIINIDNLSAVFQAIKDNVYEPLNDSLERLWSRVKSIDDWVTKLRNFRTQDAHQIAVNSTDITKLRTKLDDESASLFKILCNSAGIRGPMAVESNTDTMVYLLNQIELTNKQAKAALLLGNKLPYRLYELPSDLDLKTNLPPANNEPLIWDSVFYGSTIESAILAPNSRIGPACFANCSNLWCVRTEDYSPIEHLNTVGTMPDSMVEGGATAFIGCENLSSLVGKVQLSTEEAQADTTLSEYLDLSYCPNLDVNCFETWGELSDVTESNFDEFADVKVYLHQDVSETLLSDYGEDFVVSLKEKRIILCDANGNPLVA